MAEVRVGVDRASLHIGEELNGWTLMQIVGQNYAVLEDLRHLDGQIIFADGGGVRLDLAKTSEATSADAGKLYLGHLFQEVMNSPTDLLSTEILDKPGWFQHTVANEVEANRGEGAAADEFRSDCSAAPARPGAFGFESSDAEREGLEDV